LLLLSCNKNSEKKQLPAPCLLEPDSGPCDAYIPRYYYDQDTGECKEFVWGGCDGVVPFITLEECQEACE
ncbi:MAG: BPTI/Kunitz domain-containing protein, partial [Fidelibacterota bacterium]